MISLTLEDGTVITVAEGAWASVESADPSKEFFADLTQIPLAKRMAVSQWMKALAGVAAAFPLVTGLSLAVALTLNTDSVVSHMFVENVVHFH